MPDHHRPAVSPATWGRRIAYNPPEISALPMLLIAAIGLIVNLISMRMLEAGKSTSLNVKGAYLEVWSDMLGSIGVIAAAFIIWLTQWVWVDAVVAVGIGLWVLPRTWTLFKETTNILLEGVPEGIDLEKVGAGLSAIAGVSSVHDLHVWALTSGVPSLSAHLVLAEGGDVDMVRQAATAMLDDTFKIEHVTLQVELADCRTGREHHGLH